MEKLTDMHRKFVAAFNALDSNALAELYAENAVLAPAPGQLATGKAQIRAAFEQLLAMRPSIQIDTVGAFEMSEGTALLNGKWTLKGTGPDGSPIEMTGVSAEVFQRQPDGRWLFVIDNPFAA